MSNEAFPVLIWKCNVEFGNYPAVIVMIWSVIWDIFLKKTIRVNLVRLSIAAEQKETDCCGRGDMDIDLFTALLLRKTSRKFWYFANAGVFQLFTQWVMCQSSLNYCTLNFSQPNLVRALNSSASVWLTIFIFRSFEVTFFNFWINCKDLSENYGF